MIIVFLDDLSNKHSMVESNQLSKFKPNMAFGLKGFSNKQIAEKYFNALTINKN